MKTFKHSLLILAFATTLFACKKDKKNTEIVEEIRKEELVKKIADIIPKEYQDTLTRLGIALNLETSPPSLEGGAYLFAPQVLFKSNRKTDLPNMKFNDSRVKFFGQDNDGNIKLIGKYLLNTADTSIVTAISGKGNDFTVYGKVKSVSGSNSAVFAIVISGTKDGTVLKDIRMGLINIDNTRGGNSFIKQGEARVVFDTDKISETIPLF